MAALRYTVVYLVPSLVVIGALAGGAWNLLTPAFVFVAVPLLDLALGRDVRNPAPEDEPALEARFAFRLVTYLAAPVIVGLVAFGVAWSVRPERTWVEGALLAVSTGLATGGIGITVAHELVHRRGRLERLLGYSLLLVVGYMHWGIEHVAGHHQWVATPRDPATARRSEGLWRFFPRTVLGGFVDAWAIEVQRTARRGGLRRNRMLRFLALEVALFASVAAAFGPPGLAFLVGQAVVAVLLLEAVNYVEHWGLQRAALGEGRFEKVNPRHSWNSDQRFTNWLLFNLQRHSDHHADSARRYQLLRSFEDSPRLPAGYSAMILLATVPPLWRAVMGPRLARWESVTLSATSPVATAWTASAR